MDVGAWLRGLGLEQYAQTFHDNAIDAAVLSILTENHLEKLGLPLGHRLKLLQAIAALRETAPLPSEPLVVTRTKSSGAERRQVTVMFCDLVGSTALSARLDPEDLREVIGRYHGCVAKIVGGFDGFVAKYMGDGVLVYFGYPRAHEDDTEQAVRAGLALVDAIGGELQAPQRLQICIGLATGLVVVGDLIGEGAAQEQAIVGETPNIAARLQALAEPDAIVISDGTRRQIGARFEVADLGPQLLKGFAGPQRAWRVLSENRALGRFEAFRSGTTPLVGRDEEMELLLRRWAQARSGNGRVVMLSAEPGIGKSRLAEALSERIGGEPYIRLRYFCSPHHQDSALNPLIAQMERAAGFVHEDSPAAKLGKLQVVLTVAAASLEDMALIADLHSLPSTVLAPLPEVTPQRKKEKTFEALLRYLEGLSEQRPVLIVFEDIHWIDPSSRELLDRAIERIANWPVLLVATFRPEFQPPWTGQPHVTTLTLSRLGPHDTKAMVANVAGHHALPSELVREIAERTDGVPLFVEELTRAVLESGAQGAAALPAVPHPALSVPATLHASLMARLDRLGPAAKDVAQTGAVIGREFAYDLLASMTDLPEPQLREALDRLTNSSLLFARGEPPQSSYTFKHALVQDAAYSTLLRGRRHSLHRRIAEALEARAPDTAKSHPELVAHHFTEASLPERAIAYWVKAGQQSIAHSAMTEAVAQLRKGLSLVSHISESKLRQQHELDTQIALGRALTATQGYAGLAVGQAYARAREICEQLGDKSQLILVMFGQDLHYGVGAEGVGTPPLHS